MTFPTRDFTLKYISSSYEDVLQQYNSGSLFYILDGLGNVVAVLNSSSVGDLIVTSNMTSSMSVLSASYATTYSYSNVTILSSSFASSSISASYALTASYAQLSFDSIFSDTASYAITSIFSDTSSLAVEAISSSYSLTASYALNGGSGGGSSSISSSWASSSISSSYSLTSSYAEDSQNSQTSDFALVAGNTLYTASYAIVAGTSDFSLVAGNTLYTSSYALTSSYSLNNNISIRTITNDIILTDSNSDFSILCNNTSSITITLPSVLTTNTTIYNIKTINSGIVIITGSQNIDANPYYTIFTQYNNIKLQSDNNQWWIL